MTKEKRQEADWSALLEASTSPLPGPSPLIRTPPINRGLEVMSQKAVSMTQALTHSSEHYIKAWATDGRIEGPSGQSGIARTVNWEQQAIMRF